MARGFCFKIFSFFLCTISTFVDAEQHIKIDKEALESYAMAFDHPIKERLDHLFNNFRATFNLKTLKKAGFQKSSPRKFTNLIVTKHPDFPGYVFKLYLDAQRFYKNQPEYNFWVLRIQGAEKIRQLIDILGLQSVFKVPHKWIYILPNQLPLSQGYPNKYSILVEEDMSILSQIDNHEAWASDRVTPELLYYVFNILKELGLSDCAKPDNIPFSEDGRIAFVDTQTFNDKKVKYKKLTKSLSKSNQEFWKKLIKNE